MAVGNFSYRIMYYN